RTGRSEQSLRPRCRRQGALPSSDREQRLTWPTGWRAGGSSTSECCEPLMLSIAAPPSDTGVIRGAPDTPGCASHSKRWVLAATVLGSSIASLEASVINVVLPAIQHGLDASAGEMQWIASAYTLFLAALTLAAGSAGDRHGRRPVFALGLAILAAASA